MKAKIQFFDIRFCGYYIANSDKHVFGTVDQVFDDIMRYIQGKNLSQTQTYGVSENCPLRTFCYALEKRNSEFLLVTWNEIENKDGKVVSNRSEIENYLKGVGNSIVEEHKYLDNPGAYRYGLRSLLNSDYKLEWIRDFLDGYDKRVVIFYNYNVELDSLKNLLEKMGRSYSVYNGGEKDFTNFKNHEDGICLCNYQSGSVGINDLVISNVYIAYSPSDNYINWQQSKKRIDRNGQKHTPVYYYLCSGLESRIYHSLSVGKNFDDRVFIEEMESNLIC